jgi:hypothetical protein
MKNVSPLLLKGKEQRKALAIVKKHYLWTIIAYLKQVRLKKRNLEKNTIFYHSMQIGLKWTNCLYVYKTILAHIIDILSIMKRWYICLSNAIELKMGCSESFIKYRCKSG